MTTRDDDNPGLNSNDLLFNLTLLNGVIAGVIVWVLGITVGMSVMAGFGFIVLVMPVVLMVSWLVLRPFGLQDNHTGLANIIMAGMMVTLIGLLVLNLAT